MSLVRLERGPRSATLHIDNPARGNALTPVAMAAATALLSELADELRQEARPYGGLVIRGVGDRAFCAGYDLTSLAEETRERPNLVIPELLDLIDVLLTFPVPTIAALNGHAIGGGALLASLCDLRYARAGVRFQIPTTRIGIIYPLPGMRRLLALLGPGRALEVLLLAQDVTTEQGLAWGIYQAVVEFSELDATVGEVLGQLSQRAPIASRGALAVMRGLAAEPSPDVVDLHAEWLARCVASDDLGEGLSAARERRPPRFRGA